jgi:AcrR family transcriptional regulator
MTTSIGNSNGADSPNDGRVAARPERTYSSALREEQARQTRRRIVDAAADLFAERGYGRTTIDAVAAAAGVSRKTVFDSVGGKAQLVKLAYDFAIVGDDEPVPLADRAEVAALEAEPDPARRLAAYAAMVVNIDIRIAPVWVALEGAAATDEEARALYQELVDQRRGSMQGPALGMHAAGELRPGLTAEKAADLMWLYNDPGVYDRLVRQRGWSIAEFRAWLAEALQMHLLHAARDSAP